MVGAIIAEKGRVIARGWHEKAGGPHAEIAALEALDRAPGPETTLFVTLEPCSTKGRTGACTDAIIRSGIKRVVVGTTDPNPAHAGRGLETLRKAGIEVLDGVLADECTGLNVIFNHWIVHQRPLFAAKVALTLDGRIATRIGQSKWITGPKARTDVMRWRNLFPAVAVGAGTACADDPRLTARLADGPTHCPTRFVFDRHLLTSKFLHAKLFNDEFWQQTIVVTQNDAPPEALEKLDKIGVNTWILPSENKARYYQAFIERCIQAQLYGVWFEGGNRLLSELLAERQLDYLFAYRSPRILADEKALAAFQGMTPQSIRQAINMDEIHHTALGPDVLTRGKIVYPS